ncbi:hyperosmotically inducible protein [Collimonas sp. OK307]|uniref:BON domain-containing protein n=1 Tax=Collimonas sp. OK307 TaxID=1801620 RepID=UPI0008EA3EAA|nr:BON domain-containing protein [Collimonas sp. OK307]SFH64547.1 hyperosmotically inducible protein [Collimonas sp. OK307]
MNTSHLYKKSLRSALIIAAFGASLASGAAIAASTDAAAPQAHSDGVSATVTDTAITATIKAKLMTTDGMNKSDVSVVTTNGVVTLNGEVSSASAKSTAEAVAKRVDGVKSVDNNLTTPSNGVAADKVDKSVAKTKRVVSDSWITTKVKSEIMANSVTKGFDVSVKTTHGVVVLSGALATQDAVDHVKDIAEKVKGVKSVDTSAIIVAAK